MYKGITPTPDRGFVKKLKRLDPGLDCHFDRRYSKFMITQLGKISGRVPVVLVQGDEGGGYRQPDDRDINMLREADMHRSGREAKDRVREGEEHMIRAREREAQNAKEEIRNATKDDKLQLAGTYHDVLNLPGKGPRSAFRRIEREPPEGFTVVDKRKTARD